MKEFVEFVVKSLVNKPDEVKITETQDAQGILITVSVDKEDAGRVIGKGGKTANAIRTVARALGNNANKRVSVKID